MVKRGKAKVVFTVGKRKLAVARARVVPGIGKIWINSKPFEVWGNDYFRMRIREALILSGDLANKLDFYVNVKGGGMTGQTESVRMAISKGIVNFFKDKQLRERFMNYDRNLLVFDYRRTEPHHAGGASKRGSRRHKQRSKR